MMSHGLLARKRAFLSSPASDCVILTDGMSAHVALRLHRMLVKARFRLILCDTVEAALPACRGQRAALLLTAATARARQLLDMLAREERADHLPSAGRSSLARIAIVDEEEGGPEAVLEMLMAGADECLVWPFGAQTLARRLRMTLHAV